MLSFCISLLTKKNELSSHRLYILAISGDSAVNSLLITTVHFLSWCLSSPDRFVAVLYTSQNLDTRSLSHTSKDWNETIKSVKLSEAYSKDLSVFEIPRLAIKGNISGMCGGSLLTLLECV